MFLLNAIGVATSRQTNTGAFALWDCVRTDGRTDGRKWRHNLTRILPHEWVSLSRTQSPQALWPAVGHQ